MLNGEAPTSRRSGGGSADDESGTAVLAPALGGEPERIAFLLLPQFSLAAFTGAIEPLRVANMLSQATLFDWSVFSITGDQVQSSSQVGVQPSGSVQEAIGFRNIVICGGLRTTTFADEDLFNWLSRFARFGGSMGALCTGAFVLARAGLLNGHRCTVHWSTAAVFQEMFPLLDLSHSLFVVDGKRFSCVGGESACDMMLQHIASRHGRGLANKTSLTLLHQGLREPSAMDSCSTVLEAHVRDSRLRAALSEMAIHIESPRSLAEIAESARLSLRHLQRKFQRQVGVSPQASFLNG